MIEQFFFDIFGPNLGLVVMALGIITFCVILVGLFLYLVDKSSN